MNTSRQSSNLSKPGSRQKKVTKRQNVDVTDPDFARAMAKELSNLDKKNVSRTSSMAANLPRLGAPAVSSPKVSSSPMVPEEEKKPEEETIKIEEGDETKKQKKVKRRKKQENAEGDEAEYTDDFETDSDDDEIDQVSSANQTFIKEKFNAELKALSEASELPELNDEDFEELMNNQRQLIIEREVTHTTWLEGFIQKKENVMARLGIVSQNRSSRFNDVCGIACRLMDIPTFPASKAPSSLTRKSRSRSIERSRERSRERSSERSRDRSRGRSRDRSQAISRDKSREQSFERPAIPEDTELPAITDFKEELVTNTEHVDDVEIKEE